MYSIFLGDLQIEEYGFFNLNSQKTQKKLNFRISNKKHTNTRNDYEEFNKLGQTWFKAIWIGFYWFRPHILLFSVIFSIFHRLLTENSIFLMVSISYKRKQKNGLNRLNSTLNVK